MPTYGYRGDVNNSIGLSSAYPGGRSMGLVQPSATRSPYRNNSAGQLASVNQGRYPMQATAQAMNPQGDDVMPAPTGGMMGKPSSWWVMFFIVFLGFVFLARRFGGSEGERFSNVKLSVYNGIFLTFYIVLILNLLKVLAAKVKIPGVSELILAA